MLKFKFSSDRFAEACNILEYIGIQNGSKNLARSVLPRFMLDKDGEYIVKIVLDEDGDIQAIENETDARMMMTSLTPTRSEKLVEQLMEAANDIVKKQNGRDSNTPTSTDTKKLPDG